LTDRVWYSHVCPFGHAGFVVFPNTKNSSASFTLHASPGEVALVGNTERGFQVVLAFLLSLNSATLGDMTQAELRRLARIGAEARLEALEREIASIHQAFPDLRQRHSTAAPNQYTAEVRSAVAGVRGAVEGAVTRRRPRLSPQARKRIGEAQRKRWAALRAKQRDTAATISTRKKK
jgi:hypothetical protein